MTAKKLPWRGKMVCFFCVWSVSARLYRTTFGRSGFSQKKNSNKNQQDRRRQRTFFCVYYVCFCAFGATESIPWGERDMGSADIAVSMTTPGTRFRHLTHECDRSPRSNRIYEQTVLNGAELVINRADDDRAGTFRSLRF